MVSTPFFHFETSASDKADEAGKVSQRQQQFSEYAQATYPHLLTQKFDFDLETVAKKNCENLIGALQVPVGLAGPMLLKGDVEGEVFVPLATTEGALVASINRGCKALRAAGEIGILIEKKGMTRAPVFTCLNGAAARNFTTWIDTHFSEMQTICNQTSQHLHLLSQTSWIRGRQVYIRFVFDTDEAMGMNMVTIAIDALRSWLAAKQPDVSMGAISSNVCCDKKDSFINRLLGRGYWAQAETFLPLSVVQEVLHVEPNQLLTTHIQKNLVGSNIAGSFSQNMQVGNVVAAIYLATGQDLAHVTETSQATFSLEITEGGMYAAVTLPNVVVGTVGGGTDLPAQTEARALMMPKTKITATHLAAVVAAASLAGELSGLAALATHTLAGAHAHLGRLATDNNSSSKKVTHDT